MTPLASPIVHPPRGDLPVVLSVPHSGRDYPDWLVDNASRGKAALSSLEDPLVDRLVWRALKRGCGAVIARAPRAAVDCNRAEDDVDPSVIDGVGRGPVTARARDCGVVMACGEESGVEIPGDAAEKTTTVNDAIIYIAAHQGRASFPWLTAAGV